MTRFPSGTELHALSPPRLRTPAKMRHVPRRRTPRRRQVAISERSPVRGGPPCPRRRAPGAALWPRPPDFRCGETPAATALARQWASLASDTRVEPVKARRSDKDAPSGGKGGKPPARELRPERRPRGIEGGRSHPSPAPAGDPRSVAPRGSLAPGLNRSGASPGGRPRSGRRRHPADGPRKRGPGRRRRSRLAAWRPLKLDRYRRRSACRESSDRMAEQPWRHFGLPAVVRPTKRCFVLEAGESGIPRSADGTRWWRTIGAVRRRRVGG